MKRKVREDFNPTKEYSVNVMKCTEYEKKEVQQAFFDVGFPWEIHGEAYKYLNATKYTNTEDGGKITEYCMYDESTVDCNMTAKEFLDLVYEPERKGHVHAELMAQYAEDAKTTDKPWELWQVKGRGDTWYSCKDHPKWGRDTEYSRKPKTHIIHGVEVPVFGFTPKVGEKYYVANVGLPELFEQGYRGTVGCTFTERMIERGLIYPYTEKGKQAAILHSKAMLCIA